VEHLENLAAIILDFQDGVLIIPTVIVAPVAFLSILLLPEGLGDLLARANAPPEPSA
jgi:hypothetical protein